MEVLLTGNTGYVSKDFVKTAFPDSHVVVDGACSIDRKERDILRLQTTAVKQKRDILDRYEFDFIVFFSNYLTYRGDRVGEMEQLRDALEYCCGRMTKFVYFSGPAVTQAEETEASDLTMYAEELCASYIQTHQVSAKIVHLPYLYSTAYREDFICRIFKDAEQKHAVHFSEGKQNTIPFLAMEDLAELTYRIVDSWDTKNDVLYVPDVFGTSFEQLGKEIQRLVPGTEVTYGEGREKDENRPDDKIIRYRYGWFPRISILADLDQLYETYVSHHPVNKSLINRIAERIKMKGKAWRMIESVCLFFIAEYLHHLVGNSIQFRFIDIRLLYVVTISTVYGINMGIVAATLTSLALLGGYMLEGIDPISLFYEPSNWLPFVLYFLVGSVCGYIQMKNHNSISFFKNENTILQEKYIFTKDLYQNAVREKGDLKRQILSSKDSFGKIYDITRKLDSVNLEEIFIKTLRVMEDVLENKTIQIYSIGSNQHFARLEIASRELAETSPRSIKLEAYAAAMDAIETEHIWVNQDLDPRYPMYMIGLKRKDRLVVLIMIQEASYSQMNLYYQNLFKILCGLVETSLLRALNYQKAIYKQQHFRDTGFLKESYFKEKLRLYQSVQEEMTVTYTLVHVDSGEKSPEEAEEMMKSSIREIDTVGVCNDRDIYLILHQTLPEQAHVVIHRLEELGLPCQIISPDEMG